MEETTGATQDTQRTQNTWYETFKVQGGQMLDQVNKLIREGNVRRIIIKQDSRVVAEFPLTFGVVGALIAPALAAIGAIAALIAECTIVVERTDAETAQPPATTEQPPADRLNA